MTPRPARAAAVLAAGLALAVGALTGCGGGGTPSAGGPKPEAASVAPTSASTPSASVAATAGATKAAVTLGSGARMCDALTAADLRAAGLRPERERPEPNADGDTGAYCAYTAASGAKGGIEFDIFDGGTDVGQVWETVAAEGGGITGEMTALKLAGADEARIGTKLRFESGPPFGSVQVRAGRMVFVLTVPAGNRTRQQLVDLAALVLQRVDR